MKKLSIFTIFMVLLSSSALFGQTALQKMYTDYLSSNRLTFVGYDNQGNIVFDDQNKIRYVIFIDEKNPNRFRMGRYDPYFGETYSTKDMNRAKTFVEKTLPDVTVTLNAAPNPGGWFYANVSLKRKEDFIKVFYRLRVALSIAVDLFMVDLMKNSAYHNP